MTAQCMLYWSFRWSKGAATSLQNLLVPDLSQLSVGGAYVTFYAAALLISFLVLVVVAFVYGIMADDDTQDDGDPHSRE